ncbi:MAG TPA: replication initiation factor domain-containing protein [Pyrinomonadaceae bacterium]|nr:replication initiation factor domain-containing protein [Pyrinomonadaceae bacterium]
MKTSAFIDWLSVTHFGSTDVPQHDMLPKDKEFGKAHNGYSDAFKYSTGVIVMWNTKRPAMGLHIIYTGKVLQTIRERYGVNADEILRYHTTLQGRVSRCDFALDVHQSGLSIGNLWDELENGQAQTKSSHSRTQNGQNRGYTLYVGSRKKRKKMLRIYDKAKEVGDFVSDWLRVELETRSDVARNATRLYQDRNCTPETIAGMVLGFCDFPSVDLWQRTISAPHDKIPVGTHQTGDTEGWLLNQCAPALAKAILRDPSFAGTFASVLEHFIAKGTG